MQPTDFELARQAAAGDSAAFHVLVDRHAPGLLRLAMTLSPSRADAEDVLQETFTGAFRGLKKFNYRASVKTWLTQILVRRAAKNWHRTRRWRKSTSIDQSPGGSEAQTGRSELYGELSDKLSVRSGSAAVDHRLDVMAALQTLAEDHRQVLVLRELQQLTYEEIAGVLRVPRGTVESRLFRARGALRAKLGRYFD